jgi:hypothetical protein
VAAAVSPNAATFDAHLQAAGGPYNTIIALAAVWVAPGAAAAAVAPLKMPPNILHQLEP